MSGRIRTIKPELLEDAITAGLSDRAFRVFIGCILGADDYGNLRYEAALLKGQIYWARVDVSVESFAAALEELAAAALVVPYIVKGQRYAAIRNWDKHQKVSHPGKPRVPGPPRLSGESRETLVPDLRSPISDHEVDHDLERDLPRAHEEVAVALVETGLPADGPPSLDAIIPDAWLSRAVDIVTRTSVVDVNVQSSWRKYVAWLNERDFEAPASEARWARWVEDDCSAAAKARGRQVERDWSGPRLVAAAAPYHGFDPAKQRRGDEERRKREAEANTPENRRLALEASARLAGVLT